MIEYNEQFSCSGIDGIENNFFYNLENSEFDNTEWIFRIIAEDILNDNPFLFSVKEFDEGNAKVIMMNHHNNVDYIAKGIPEKIIEISAIKLNKSIHSSSNIAEYKIFDGEFRSLSADKVWERLVNKNLAIYNTQTDIFTYKMAFS